VSRIVTGTAILQTPALSRSKPPASLDSQKANAAVCDTDHLPYHAITCNSKQFTATFNSDHVFENKSTADVKHFQILKPVLTEITALYKTSDANLLLYKQ
jgi:hypothetical protein